MLDSLFLRARASPLLYRFTWLNRVLLAAAFIPTGSVKLMGQRFTLMGPESPIGAFFEAMYQTGLYWQFIGFSQVLAGILLLIPAASHLGAAIFFPILLNILVITISLGFGGTPLLVAPMMLAVTYLCCWDWHRFRPLFTTRSLAVEVPELRLEKWEKVGFFVFAFSLMNFFGVTRSFFPTELAGVFLITGLGAGVLTLGRFVWLAKSGRLPEAGSRRANLYFS